MCIGNTMRFPLALRPPGMPAACRPKLERMQGRGGEVSAPRLDGQEASSSFSLPGERAEPVKGHCPF